MLLLGCRLPSPHPDFLSSSMPCPTIPHPTCPVPLQCSPHPTFSLPHYAALCPMFPFAPCFPLKLRNMSHSHNSCEADFILKYFLGVSFSIYRFSYSPQHLKVSMHIKKIPYLIVQLYYTDITCEFWTVGMVHNIQEVFVHNWQNIYHDDGKTSAVWILLPAQLRFIANKTLSHWISKILRSSSAL